MDHNLSPCTMSELAAGTGARHNQSNGVEMQWTIPPAIYRCPSLCKEHGYLKELVAARKKEEIKQISLRVVD
ncbi:hypothetical protein CEXT_251101 [Caerostris extrusa]|uniref:Uncharacterized protein n=1 Tax=Caerostris extrusa TaxID=172846 RepID=A0AAV4Y199_CAEEX|nr:hypothetical protein CEXT_251101 [Caerostris extrusa]